MACGEKNNSAAIRAEAPRAEETQRGSADLVQGIVLVTFPAASGRGRVHPYRVMLRRSLVLMIALPVSTGRLRGG